MKVKVNSNRIFYYGTFQTNKLNIRLILKKQFFKNCQVFYGMLEIVLLKIREDIIIFYYFRKVNNAQTRRCGSSRPLEYQVKPWYIEMS